MVLFTACTVQQEYWQPPELRRVGSVREDTALVERGDIVLLQQHHALVRTHSQGLSFGNTGLRFGEYFVVPGQEVSQGELLVKLDTEQIENRIEANREELRNMRIEHGFENEAITLDILDLQLDLAELLASDLIDASRSQAIELKRMDIEARELALAHNQERQSLTLRHAEENLNRLIAQLGLAEIRAPFDGVITHQEAKSPGEWVEPYAALVYISDKSELFVEYSGTNVIHIPRMLPVTGIVGTRTFSLARITATPQEAAFYSAMRMTPPVRFAIQDPDHGLSLGDYVTLLVRTAFEENVLRIPINALYEESGDIFYVHLSEQGQKTIRIVEPGMRNRAYVQIISGLQEGDEVYVKS
jgi:multidrug efflux pump subunit AcrA (membrane-fusion protein)